MRALILALSFWTFTVAAGGATFIVSNTGDAGPGSLPQAFDDANDNSNPAETDLIEFAIPGPGPHTIKPLVPLAAYEPVIIDGTSQPGYAGAPIIVVDGSLAGVALAGINLQAVTGGSTLRGLVVNNFNGRGINLYSDANLVEHCYVGTDVTGTVAQGNDGAGVLISAQAGNIIRGNLISGNTQGIGIFGFNHDNLVQWNLIGTDITGTAKLGNTSDGIQIAGRNNTVEGNVISGNDGAGVYLIDASTKGNVVKENFIGTDLTGMAGLGNAGAGVWIDGAEKNRIGTSGSGNLISGNGSDGVYVHNGDDNSIQANRIGSDITGNAALGNGRHGVFLRNASSTLVGGEKNGGNLISGNQTDGVVIQGAQASGNKVFANLVGVNATADLALPNRIGVRIRSNPHKNTIENNVISGNLIYGIEISFTLKGFNTITRNAIGTDPDGILNLGNGLHGVYLFLAGDNSIGEGVPSRDAVDNRIAYNGGAGVFVGLASSGNRILMNSIFNNAALGIDLYPAGVTANDNKDRDIGANGRQNFPVLTGAVTDLVTATTSITVTLHSKPSTQYRVELFVSDSPDPSGQGEGQQFIAAADCQTNLEGNTGAFVVVADGIYSGKYLTATATDPDGNTSEFSAAIQVVR